MKKIFAAIALMTVAVFMGSYFYFSSISVETTKDLNEFSLGESDVRSSDIFSNEFIVENNDAKNYTYDILESIDAGERRKMAEYMDKNNYSIKPGNYYIKKPVFNNGVSVPQMTFEDMLEEFEFEKKLS